MLPVLRYYRLIPGTTAQLEVVPAPPAGRALVISKIVVAAFGATGRFWLRVGGAGIAEAIPILPGEVYTETGIVLTAGQNLGTQVETASGCVVSVFGEEVDN